MTLHTLYIRIAATVAAALLPLAAAAQEFTDTSAYFGKSIGLRPPRLLPDSAFAFNHPGYEVKKHPVKAAAETFLINAGVWAFDRYALNAEFAHISMHTIRDNIKRGFVWDNDQFSTNLFAHPYHGGLYFNSARSNGMNFWQSIPYAAAGSLMWEFMAENEPAAINDWIATTVGGVAMGEMTNRISLMVIDESERGWPRVGREAIAFIASPIRAINRMINGDMWRVKTSHFKYHDFSRIPVHLHLGLGSRYIADDRHLFRGEYSPFLNLGVTYGDPFIASNRKPYDYFTLNLTANLTGNQPLVSEVNLMAKIWTKPIAIDERTEMTVGVFQHFNYYDSESVIDGEQAIPFKISETASFGPGAIFRLSGREGFFNLEQRLFVSGVLLGGSLTDYYRVIDRNYNMGSGYGIKSFTDLHLGSYSHILVSASHLHLFTWKGYSAADLAAVNPLYLNAQGDKGSALLTILSSKLRFRLSRALTLGFDGTFYIRHTRYADYPDIDYRTFETRVGVYCNL